MNNNETHNSVLKNVNMELFGIKPEHYENLSAFHRLRRDQERILNSLPNQISATGKEAELFDIAIDKHNDHVRDSVKAMNISSEGKGVCTCGEKACFAQTLLIGKPKVEVEAPGKALEVVAQSNNEFAELSRFANAF